MLVFNHSAGNNVYDTLQPKVVTEISPNLTHSHDSKTNIAGKQIINDTIK